MLVKFEAGEKQVTVEELIRLLSTLPADAKVSHDGCCGGGCYQPVVGVEIVKELGIVVLIRETATIL